MNDWLFLTKALTIDQYKIKAPPIGCSGAYRTRAKDVIRKYLKESPVADAAATTAPEKLSLGELQVHHESNYRINFGSHYTCRITEIGKCKLWRVFI